MALWIQISPGSNEPVYQQVVSQISQAIAKGQLAIGDKLPAVRKLAAELVINPNTVARAYTQLEQAHLVTTKTGSGTFVSDPKLREHDSSDINILAERIDSLITRALNLGFKHEDLVSLFRDRLAKFTKQNNQSTGGNENE